MKPIHRPHPLPGATLSPGPGPLATQQHQPVPGAKPGPLDLQGEGLWGGFILRGAAEPNLVMAAFKSYPGPSSFLHSFLPSPVLRPRWSHLSRQTPIELPMSALKQSPRRIPESCP